MANSYKDLIAWQKGIQLVKSIYELTSSFPDQEKYGLISQIRRAAVSIPSNIAEGQARFSPVDFRHFLRITRGSLAELETQLVLAHELRYITHQQLDQQSALIDELGRVINGLINSIAAAKSAAN